MAESKMDRSNEHVADDSFVAKGSLSVGLDVEKSPTGFVDDFKDQQSESNIPLSPQWLYAKPTETKDGRPQGILEPPQENKRDRRRNNNITLDTENSQNTRRWREEERETGLLSRRVDRDRSKKDSSNPNPNPNPNPSNNSATKWSSRWGPDDRETQPKKPAADISAAEKEHYHEPNPNPNPNFALRPLSEADSRDKWRPRHRQEAGPNRGAPGFGGSDRAGAGQAQTRQETANVGFAPGRGRAATGAYGRGRGEVGKSGYRYPRGKLLDIYRRNGPAGLNYENAPGFRKVGEVTVNVPVPPLAFVAPDKEEEVTLEEIYKGKQTGADANGPMESPVNIAGSSQIGSGLLGLGEEKYSLPASLSVENSPAVLDARSPAGLPNDLIEDPFSQITEKPLKQSMLSKLNLESVDLGPAFNAAMNLPDDSTSLFDTSFIRAEALEEEQNPNPNPNRNLSPVPLEEMSFFYRDPQGGVQGPFLGIDIMSWYEEGYFGLDLPICPCDAGEGTPYCPLADVMPHLRGKSEPVPVPVGPAGDADVAQFGHGSGSFDYGGMDKLASDGMIIEGSLEGGLNSKFEDQWSQNASSGLDNEEIIYAGRPRSGMGKHPTNEMTDMPLWASNTELGDSSINLPRHEMPTQRETNTNTNPNAQNDNITPLGLLWSELESPHSKHPLSSNLPSNYRKPDLNPMKQQQEISHFALEEQLLSEQIQRQQMQQIQQEQFLMRAGRGLGPQQASELEQLLKLQYEIEQQRQLQLKQQQLKQQQQQQLKQKQQQEQQRREQMLRQQKIQEQLMLEQILREQQLQEQQMLREQQFLKELQIAQAQQLHRQQQDAAIEQLIQAKFGPAGQRQMINPTIEQQILLGLQQRDPIQAQQLALALRQQQQQQQEQQRLEEEMLLRGVRGGPGLHRTNSSRISQLERSLSLHEQLQSMERSLSMNGPALASPRNPDFAQTLAQLQGFELQERQLQERERQERERQLQERERQQQRAALFGVGPMDRFWDGNPNPNSQLERNMIEHQLQLEAENQRRIESQRRGLKPGLTLEDPHLNEMMYQNMPLQSPHGSFKDPSMLFPRRNPSPSPNNPNPNSSAGVNIEGMQGGFARPGSGSGSRPGSFVEKQFYGNFNEMQNEDIQNDVQYFESFKGDFGEAAVQREQEMVRAPTPPARLASVGSSDDVIFKYEMGDDSAAFTEEAIEARQHGISRADSRASQKNETDQQINTAPRPPSRPTSADAAKQEARPHASEAQTATIKRDASKLVRVPSSSNTESDASGRSFIDMLKSTKKPPQPAPQPTDDSSDSKGAKKGKKKGRQIDPALLGFKVHSNRIMMGEIQRPDEC